MAYRAGLFNFSKGELGPELIGRVDVAAYNAGLERAVNVQVRKYGGVTKRPGTRLVAEVYDATKPVRLMPFQFSIEQSYALEMGQGYMRPAALGGMVLGDELVVTGITNAVQAQITAAYHGYSAGDQIFLNGIIGMEAINRRILTVVASVDTDNFTVDLDTRTFGVFTGNAGGLVRTGAVSDPAPPVVPPLPTPTQPPPTTYYFPYGFYF